MSCIEAAAELDWAMWAKSGVIMKTVSVLGVCQAVGLWAAIVRSGYYPVQHSIFELFANYVRGIVRERP